MVTGRRVQARPRRGHGRLGGAVDVEEPPVAVPARDQVVRAGLARHEQEPQPRQILVDRGEQRRHAAQCRHALLDQEPAVPADQAGRWAGARASRRGERNPDLLDREVERDRHALVHAIARAARRRPGSDPDEVADAGVIHRDALGPARRAGGVDDVTELVPVARLVARGSAGGGSARRSRRPRRGTQSAPIGHARAGARASPRGHRGVLDDEREAVRREARIQRHVRRVELRDRQHRRIAVGRPVEEQAHPVSGAHAAAARCRASWLARTSRSPKESGPAPCRRRAGRVSSAGAGRTVPRTGGGAGRRAAAPSVGLVAGDDEGRPAADGRVAQHRHTRRLRVPARRRRRGCPGPARAPLRRGQRSHHLDDLVAAGRRSR